MALIRNKVSNELIVCSEFEAKILSCPEGFRAWVKETLKGYDPLDENDLGSVYTQIMDTNATTQIGYKLKDGSASVRVRDVLDGNFEQIPDTDVSRLLYGNQKRG